MENKAPLTQTQLGIYFESIMHEGEAYYNTPKLFRLAPSLSLERLARALETAVAAHPALGARIRQEADGTPMMVQAETFAPGWLTVEDLSEDELVQLKSRLMQPFHLATDRLFCIRLLRTERGAYMFVDFHHVIYDGTSMRIFLSDVDRAYRGETVVPESFTAYDVAREEVALRRTEAYTQAKDWYLGEFGDCPEPILGEAIDQEDDGEPLYGEVDTVISTTREEVSRFCRAIGITPHVLTTAAFGRLLGVVQGKTDVAFATIYMGRKDERVARTMDMMVKTLPVRCRMDDKALTVRQYLATQHAQMQGCRQHTLYSFAELSAQTGLTADVLFAWQAEILSLPTIGGTSLERLPLSFNATGASLSLQLSAQPDGMHLNTQYRIGRFTEDFIRRLADSYDAVLHAFISQPDTLLKATSIVSPRQAEELDGLRQTCLEKSARRFDYFHQALEYWAETTPEATAVVACDATLSYAELNRQADAIAHALRERGVRGGDRVCLLLPRRSFYLAAMFGVMKAGAAYIPCDPEYPAERIRLITEDSHARFIITTPSSSSPEGESLSAGLQSPLVLIPGEQSERGHEEAANGKDALPPFGEDGGEALAYLIYTSGSTGRPKGVMLRHRGICNYLTPHPENRHIYAMDALCRTILGITTVSFDLSLKEIGAALFCGKTLVFANEDETVDPLALAALMQRTGVDGFSGTPSRLKMFLESPEFQEALKHCRYIVLGGEKYPPTLLPQLQQLLPQARLFNTYGPTEITVSSNACELTRAKDITIGRPLLGVKEYVVDNDLNELPVGVTGELLIGGEGVGAGYNGLPDKTAEAFITYRGKRCYKSGDYAYWTPEGHVVILGRKDHQIKLNGLRIELGEVETALNRQPQVKTGVVMIKSVKGRDLLVAYYVPSSPVEPDRLKEQMSRSLTHYMVPSVFIPLERMPISPNGKTDLKALPEPTLFGQAGQAAAKKAEQPASPDEEALKKVAAKVIGTGDFGVTDNLISAGLTSLLSIRLSILVKEDMGQTLAVKDIMRNPTVRELAKRLVRSDETVGGLSETVGGLSETVGGLGNATVTAPATVPAGVKLLYPLSENQRGVYIDWELHRDALQYNMPSLTLLEDIDAERLQKAIRAAVNAHPYMKTRLVQLGDDVMQEPHPDEEVRVSIVDLADTPVGEKLAADLHASFWQELVRPFDLFHDCLYRFSIYLAGRKTILFADRHHIISDGLSNGILERDIWQAYDGGQIQPEAYTALDNAAAEKALAATSQYAEAEAYFDGLLSGIETTVYPHALAQPDTTGKRTLTLDLPATAISPFCRAEGITPSNFFLTAFCLVLHRATHEESIFLTTVDNGRDDLRLNRSIGMFVKTLPVVFSRPEGTKPSVREALHAMQEQLFNTQANNFYPFTRMVERHGVRPEIMYVFQGGLESTPRGTKLPLSLDTAKMPLELMVFTPTADTFRLHLNYDSALYDEAAMQQLLSIMATAAQNLTRCESLAAVSLVSPEEHARIASFHEGPKAEVPIRLYHKLLEASVEAHPDSLALVATDGTFTYDQMNRQMNRIAHALIQRGVQRGDRVALLLPRISRLILSQYGVLKAGGAYIPCDPNYPTERINLILGDSASTFIITTADRCAEFGSKALDVEELLLCSDEGNPCVEVRPDDLAYLIYTSGSTGRPKGVQLMHKGVCNYHCPENLIQSALAAECKAALAITTISFDMSVWETGSPLMLGKTLVLAGDDQCNDPVALASLISAYDIGCITATTSRFMQLLECEEFEQAFRRHIRMAYQGGEALSSALLTKLQTYGVRIFNGYGPTETIANSHAAELTRATFPHIGRPCCNYTNYIVDADGNELPIGMTGELLIGGDSVARGYNNLPDQTAERFVADPATGERIYHSGDYARWLPDGNVAVLGRKDNQVKLRGLRIELGEVEAAITRVSGIKSATALIRKIQGRDHLCAWFTANRTVDIEALKLELKQTLTAYMIPTAYLQMDEFPLTPNGKTNLKALPEPTVQAVQTEHAAAEGQAEEDFCRIFAEVLGLDEVGATDNFFDMGGTSLVAMRVVMRAAKAGHKIVYKDVFDCPTPRQLAALTAPEPQTTSPSPADLPKSAPVTSTDYDYTDIDRLLQHNTLGAFTASAWQDNLRPLGTCVVTGATGYLGIHVVKELLDREDVPVIYCLVRSHKAQSAESRLRTLLFYFFGDTYAELIGSRLRIIDGDVTSTSWVEQLLPALTAEATVFNCAANVKHFSAGTDIEDINIGGCDACIDLCLRTGARLIQTSTHSIAGAMVSDTPTEGRTLSEDRLFIGQTLLRQYTHAKFIAERNVLDAVCHKGLDAKVMRYGNLAARSTDGEFQINFRSNGFMGRLKAYQAVGCIPFENLDKTVEFSPINEVARATVLLSQTPRAFTVFNPNNVHAIPLSDVVTCMKEMGYCINSVEKEAFDAVVLEAGQDPVKAAILQSLLAYNSNTRGKCLANNNASNAFTTQVLHRMGFQWSFTTWDYIKRFLKVIQGLGFFDDDYER